MDERTTITTPDREGGMVQTGRTSKRINGSKTIEVINLMNAETECRGLIAICDGTLQSRKYMIKQPCLVDGFTSSGSVKFT